MKRFLLSAVMVGVAGLFAGCGDESGTKVTEKKTDAGGTTTTTTENKVKSTGDSPPPSSSGETGKSPAPAPK